MELIIVLAIALIVLGPKRLPDAGKSLGKGMRDFKDALAGGDRHDDDERELPAIVEERERSADRERSAEREPVAR